jgi:hypothetical protein
METCFKWACPILVALKSNNKNQKKLKNIWKDNMSIEKSFFTYPIHQQTTTCSKFKEI